MHAGESTENDLTPPSVLAVNIQRLRKARKLTQRQLANQLGMSLAHANRIEVSHTYAPSSDIIPKLMNVLGVSADELFTDISAMTSEQRATEDLVSQIRALDGGQRDVIAQAVDVFRLKKRIRIVFLPIPQDDVG